VHDSYMTEMAVSEAREQLAAVIESATRTGEPVYLTRRGRPMAVVVDPAVFERLLDDAEDALERAELALARDQDDYVPWEQVKAELGLS
jgi:prevent-host-death family protein